jgi:hypothetical protein
MKRAISWYNLLLENNLIDMEKSEEKEEVSETE